MKSLNLLVLRCKDMEKARRFYEVLGMRFAKHAHGTGPEHFACEDGGGVFELYPTAKEAPADMTGLGFSAADLEDIRLAFDEAGFAPEPIKDNSWGRTFVVRDPDGRRVEMKQM